LEAFSILGNTEQQLAFGTPHVRLAFEAPFLHLSAWLISNISGMWVAPSLHTDGLGCGILILIGGSYSS